MCNNTQKKKAAGTGKDFTLFFGVMLHFNFKCVVLVWFMFIRSSTEGEEKIQQIKSRQGCSQKKNYDQGTHRSHQL